MTSEPVLVTVTVNLPATAPLLTATTTTVFPANYSNTVTSDHTTTFYSNHVEHAPVPTTTTITFAPVLLPKTTTVPANSPTIFSPTPDPKITTTVPSNPPTHVIPEPDTTTTTCVYSSPQTQNTPVPDPNPHPQNFPVLYPTPPPTPVSPVPDAPSPTTSTPTVVADFHGVKWYDYEDVIDLDKVTSLQWKFTNQFSDPVYPNSVVWMSMFDAWLMIYGK